LLQPAVSFTTFYFNIAFSVLYVALAAYAAVKTAKRPFQHVLLYI